MNVLDKLGIKKQTEPDFAQTLFYFIREFKINPLDEEWVVGDKVIIKKGMSIPLFNALMEQMEKHYEREKREYEKSRRRR